MAKLYRIKDTSLQEFINEAKKARKTRKPKKRISLEGIISGSKVTDKDFEEIKKQWYSK